MSTPVDPSGNSVTPANGATYLLWCILGQLGGILTELGGGGIVPPGTPRTLNAQAISDTAAHVIPVGAMDIGILIQTGAGTINGVAWPVNVPFNFAGPLAATITLTLSSGTALLTYGT